jgi:hypothetical protein
LQKLFGLQKYEFFPIFAFPILKPSQLKGYKL